MPKNNLIFRAKQKGIHNSIKNVKVFLKFAHIKKVSYNKGEIKTTKYKPIKRRLTK